MADDNRLPHDLPLVPGEVLSLSPALAVAIGLNQAIVLQRVHSYLSLRQHPRQGRYWVCGSYPEWRERDFPFWSVATVQRVFASLEHPDADDREGRVPRGPLLVHGRFNSDPTDRTKWYTLDYDEVDRILHTLREHGSSALLSNIADCDDRKLQTETMAEQRRDPGESCPAEEVPQDDRTAPEGFEQVILRPPADLDAEYERLVELWKGVLGYTDRELLRLDWSREARVMKELLVLCSDAEVLVRFYREQRAEPWRGAGHLSWGALRREFPQWWAAFGSSSARGSKLDSPPEE